MIARISRLGRLAPIVLALSLVGGAAFAAADDDAVARHSRTLLFGAGDELQGALAALRGRGNTDVAAALVLALRYRRYAGGDLSRVLSDLTGHQARGWFDWMVWQEAHPEIVPHPSYAALKLDVLQRIDPEFLRFFEPQWARPEAMRIRMEEITWGGVPVDGIPSLDNPTLIAGRQAGYLQGDDLVFGVEINGDARAYPLRIMGWHEMFNEVIGGVPVALAYCTLCGSGIRDVAAAKAWPLAAFEGGRVINDRIGQRDIVLIGDSATRSVRAYDRGGRTFEGVTSCPTAGRGAWHRYQRGPGKRPRGASGQRRRSRFHRNGRGRGT